MSGRLHDLVAWLDGRSVRERAFLLAASLAIPCALWSFLLMDALAEKRATIERQVLQVEEETQKLELQSQKILDARSIDPNRALSERRQALAAQLGGLDTRIREHTVSLVGPTEMTRFLEELLSQETDLRLVRLENLGPEPILEVLEPLRRAGATDAGVFKHGFVIEFQGRYLSTLSYLRALESLPWKFLWDALSYEVQEYPKGRITIRGYTLSADEGWLGV